MSPGILCNQDNKLKSESENPKEPSSSLEKLISWVIVDPQFVWEPELVDGLEPVSLTVDPVAFA